MAFHDSDSRLRVDLVALYGWLIRRDTPILGWKFNLCILPSLEWDPEAKLGQPGERRTRGIIRQCIDRL